MKATPLDAGVYTIARLARARRRLDRQRRAVARALEAMQRGATLHLAYGPGREWWALSNGWQCPSDVAAILIARPDIQAVGDALFSNCRAQTWRYLDPQKGEYR